MKINILYDNPEIVTGYVNVDPFVMDNPDIQCTSPDNLHFCSDGEAEEIVCNNVLSYYRIDKAERVMQHFIQKLSHQGTLTIQDLNPYSITRKVTLRELNIVDLNKYLFGEKHPKKSLIGIDEIANLMTHLGLRITYKGIMGDEFIITGVRP